MATTVTPIKVDAQTDKLITHAAHFLGQSKKALVDEAVREYIDNHRAAIQVGVSDALLQLDGSLSRSVALLTGLSLDDLDEVGGLPESE